MHVFQHVVEVVKQLCLGEQKYLNINKTMVQVEMKVCVLCNVM